MKFIDISNNQGDINLVNVVNNNNNNNLDFVFVKLSEGVGWKDPKADSYIKELRKLNVKIGMYHYVRWENPENTAYNEAQSFIDFAKAYYKQGDFLALDFEVNVSSGRSAYTLCKDFINYVNSAFPTQDCWIYANTSTFNKYSLSGIGAPNWVADYGINNGMANTKPSISNMIAWQYTSVGRLSGYDGNLDLNQYYGESTKPSSASGFEFRVVQDKVYKSGSNYYNTLKGNKWYLERDDRFNGYFVSNGKNDGLDWYKVTRVKNFNNGAEYNVEPYFITLQSMDTQTGKPDGKGVNFVKND